MSEELIREQIAYWDRKATDAMRAADYAHNQLRLHVEQLAALGGCAMSEDQGARPSLVLIEGGQQ